MVAVGIVLYIGELVWRRKNRASGGVGDNKPDVVGDASGAVASAGAISPDGDVPADGVPVENAGDTAGGECCGLHLVCEKDSLSPMSDEILYYDDEELDRFVGRAPDSYTPDEVEEFRDVLMTLRPDDVAGWARSVTQRRLELPPEVKDELLLLVNEQRYLKRS